MIFLIFITLITGLQVLHRRLLHQLFPPRFDRWVLPFLVAVHVPLALYMAVRLSGGSGAALWLRPWARAGARGGSTSRPGWPPPRSAGW